VSTRANVASAVASVGVLFIGWQIGAQGTTPVAVPAGSSGTRSSGTTTTAPRTTTTTTAAPRTTAPAPAPAEGGHGGGGTTVTLSVPAGASGTFTGDAVTHRWGSVEVTVTLASGKITALSETVDDDGDGNSARINSQAVPMLKRAILGSGGGQVSTISGATYTTAAYLKSLQSALDQAG